MSKYGKLIAAIVGVIAILLGPNLVGIGDGTTILGMGQDTIVGVVASILTALGVWGVPNAPAE